MTDSPAGELRIAAREFDGFTRSFRAQAESYDRPVNVTFHEVQALQQSMVEEDLLTSGECDLALVLTDWLPRLIAEGKLLPLNDHLTGEVPVGYPDCWVPALTALQTDEHGRLYGFPYHDGPVMLLYRRDLFESAEEREGFQASYGYPLEPARTWSQFVDQAVWFTRPEQGLWGTVLAGFPDEHNTVYDFLTQLWSRGGDLFDIEGRPQLDSPQAKEALGFLAALWHEHRVVDPEARAWASVESGVHFANGEAAMMVNWCGFAALSADPSSPTHGLIGCTVTPAAEGPSPVIVTMNGYYVLAIPSGCRDVEGAYRFMVHAASPQMDRETCVAGGSGTRVDTWADPEVRALAPYYERLVDAHEHSRALPPDPRWPEISAVINDLVAEMIDGGDLDSTLATAQQRLVEIVQGNQVTE